MEELILWFLATFVLELIAYLLFFKERKLIIAGYCLLINLFSWPIANFIYGEFGYFYLIELGVIAVEGVAIKFLFKTGWKRAMVFSLIFNLLSAFIGVILSIFISIN